MAPFFIFLHLAFFFLHGVGKPLLQPLDHHPRRRVLRRRWQYPTSTAAVFFGLAFEVPPAAAAFVVRVSAFNCGGGDGFLGLADILAVRLRGVFRAAAVVPRLVAIA
jgi:hypothetical protein